jgi:hypothetical protein
MNVLQYLNNLRPAIPMSVERPCTIMSNGELRRHMLQGAVLIRWREGDHGRADGLPCLLAGVLSKFKEPQNHTCLGEKRMLQESIINGFSRLDPQAPPAFIHTRTTTQKIEFFVATALGIY